MNIKKFENELFYNFIDDECFRNELLSILIKAVENRKKEGTQKEMSLFLEIPLTKLKQIENGTCVDFNSTNNYINYFTNYRLTFFQSNL